MKCRKCGAHAVLNMRQHRLALCREHFLEWIPEQTQRFIERYRMFTPEERILVAVSGGKDSLGLWDVLQRLGYQADGLYISLGIDGGSGYSATSHGMAAAYAEGARPEAARRQRPRRVRRPDPHRRPSVQPQRSTSPAPSAA